MKKLFIFFSFIIIYSFTTTIAQVQNVTHDTDNIQLTVFNDGIIGVDIVDNIGIGFTFEGYSNALYSGGAILGSAVYGITGMIFSIRDNVNIAPMNDFTSNDDFNQISETKFTDTNAPSPFGVVVKQRTFSNSGDDYVYFNYTIINTTYSDISGLYVGVFADWDVGDYSLNRGGYNEGRNLAYQYEYGSPNNPNYYGIVALSGLGGARVTTEGAGSDRLLPFEFMSTFNNEVITTNADYRTFIGSGPFNILIGESVEVGFAFVAGENLEDLKTNADLAIAKWNSVKVNVEDNPSDLPLSFELQQNYPNPFNPSTTISYSLPESANIRLEVFDFLGRKVATLVDEYKNPGNYSIVFNAKDLPSGFYIYRLSTDKFTESKKILLIK